MKLLARTLILLFLSYPGLSQESKAPKNIILMIGDGMGLAQISSAFYHNSGDLHMLQMPYIGLMSTHAHDNLVTDSGAGGTAIACGIKTYNGAIGVNSDTVPVPSVMTLLKRKGWATGIVVTCGITHATPAAFFAHQPSRKMDEEIAADFIHSKIDIAIGGGKKYFEKRKSDKRNLIKELQNQGYQVTDWEKFKSIQGHISNLSGILVFTAEEHPDKVSKGRNYLPDATSRAIEFLDRKSENGFFLMVEGSQIDWAGHDNDFPYILDETLDFDLAVKRALDFAREDGETLVIVLADHETGGLALNPGSKWNQVKAHFSSKDHTAIFVPVFAFGPGSEHFAGFYDNTNLKEKIISIVK